MVKNYGFLYDFFRFIDFIIAYFHCGIAVFKNIAFPIVFFIRHRIYRVAVFVIVIFCYAPTVAVYFRKFSVCVALCVDSYFKSLVFGIFDKIRIYKLCFLFRFYGFGFSRSVFKNFGYLNADKPFVIKIGFSAFDPIKTFVKLSRNGIPDKFLTAEFLVIFAADKGLCFSVGS